MLFQIVSLISEILAALVGVYYYRNYFKNNFYHYFIALLIITAIVESVGAYLVHTDYDSYFLSYFFILTQNVLSYIIFKHLLSNKKITYLFFSLFFILWCFYFGDRLNIRYVLILGAINVSFISLLYLRQLLISDNIFYYKEMLPFWISIAYLIFYLSSIPFFSMIHFFDSRGLFFIIYLLIIIMNSIIIYGLLTCNNKKEKY